MGKTKTPEWCRQIIEKFMSEIPVAIILATYENHHRTISDPIISKGLLEKDLYVAHNKNFSITFGLEDIIRIEELRGELRIRLNALTLRELWKER